MKWPADKIERRKVDSLIPYIKNSRTHTPEQVANVAASIKEWGWTTPVLIDEAGGLIAGHCRIQAAQKLGLDEVPCMVAAGWSEAQKKAYIIADNRLAEAGAGWDMDMLKVEFEDLKALDFNLDLTGFDNEFVKGLMEPAATEGLTDPDDVPENVETRCKPGDLWVLGGYMECDCGERHDL
jgi:ParB-like chromosome segregation protein Spo0J